ncbi:MAG: ParB/RepB/Spo0J family partition protein [Syntrophaceticus sp.]
MIPLDKIKCGKFQPRFDIENQEIDELVESIKEVGVLQPVVVRPSENCYELIAGERRVRASVKAGLKEINAVICALSDREAAEVALVENIQRRNLHFLEEAEGFQNLIEHFHLTQSEVAQKMGLSQSTIANKIRLLKLDQKVREKIYQLKLSERHARALLELDDINSQMEALEYAEKNEIKVRDWETIIKAEKTKKSDKIISREIKKRKKQNKQNIKPIVNDLRLFINSLEQGVRVLQEAGLEVQLLHQQNDDGLRIIIDVVENRSHESSGSLF